MRVLDPGHSYELDTIDGSGAKSILIFVKREGEMYPGNVGAHPGVTCQEVLRALIDRVEYVEKQIPDERNRLTLSDLRFCLWRFEARAAVRKWRPIPPFHPAIEKEPTCTLCGHIQ